MATPTSGNGNLVDELDEAFMSLVEIISKEEETFTPIDKEEVRVDIDQCTMRFIDIARQLEAFFLQKRFLLSALKPELIVKEDISELRLELARKDDLIRRHYDKIAVWQNLLADLQQVAKSPAQNAMGQSPMPAPMPSPLPGPIGPPQQQPSPQVPGGMVSPQQALFMQQQAQQQQQQQQQRTGPVAGGPMPGALLQGPLAYLEKTTSNIGMGDGRR